MNVCTLMGRLTGDPELKSTQSGVSVTSFTLAVDRSYTPKGEERQTDFINCVAWRNTAEFIAKYFRKGQRMAVKGELQQRSYTANDGNKRYVYEVIVDGAFFCESQKQTDTQYTPEQAAPTGGFEVVSYDEDFPF